MEERKDTTTNETAGTTGGASQTSTDGLDAIVKLVQNIGMNEELWRSYLGDKLAKRIKETDLKDAAGRVRDLAGLSAEKVKSASSKNPGLFYAGVAAIVVGAGLVTRAVRGENTDVEGEFPTGGEDLAH